MVFWTQLRNQWFFPSSLQYSYPTGLLCIVLVLETILYIFGVS